MDPNNRPRTTNADEKKKEVDQFEVHERDADKIEVNKQRKVHIRKRIVILLNGEIISSIDKEDLGIQHDAY